GHFVVEGLTKAANQLIDVSAAQLAQTSFQSGGVSDPLAVRAFDGTLRTDERRVRDNAAVNHAPVVAAADSEATHGQIFTASSLFSVSDPDVGATVTAYEFADGTGDPMSGNFVVNGNLQPSNQVIDVSAGQLAQTSFQSGLVSDTLAVRAFDGTL